MNAIFILSSKSSGSTALQNCFKENYGYKTVAYTLHNKEETLYWSKVASILGMNQDKLYRSVVPLEAKRAVRELNIFFKGNGLTNVKCSLETTEKEFQDYYYRLHKKTGEKFIEKSPHHLFNRSNLELISNYKKAYSGKVNVQVIGLVRHPQAVLFSAWSRWKYLPNIFQKVWWVSYTNLLAYKSKLGIIIWRYEDLVREQVRPDILPGEKRVNQNFSFKTTSLDKWKNDKTYAFRISREVRELSKLYGYADFNPGKSMVWNWLFLKHYFINMSKNLYRKLR